MSHASGKPILFLPPEPERSDLPEGWTDVQIDGQTYSANFVKVAVNVVRQAGGEDNELPRILRGWFGPDAGAPGTRRAVALEQRGAEWHLAPLGQRRGELQLWRAYSREEIPPLFGLKFSTGVWNKGFVKGSYRAAARRRSSTAAMSSLRSGTATTSRSLCGGGCARPCRSGCEVTCRCSRRDG